MAQGKEIERKFLLTALPGHLKGSKERIRQGYLLTSRDGSMVRVRKGGGEYFLTVKSGGGLVRDEVEIGLTHLQFARLWPLTAGRRILKWRYSYRCEGATIEVDRYDSPHKGLLTAEIEFPNAHAARLWQPPPWLAREVTGQPKYRNQNLAG